MYIFCFLTKSAKRGNKTHFLCTVITSDWSSMIVWKRSAQLHLVSFIDYAILGRTAISLWTALQSQNFNCSCIPLASSQWNISYVDSFNTVKRILEKSYSLQMFCSTDINWGQENISISYAIHFYGDRINTRKISSI